MAIYNLMEDVATAEISRSQVWQWIKNAVVLDNGQVVTARAGRRDRGGRDRGAARGTVGRGRRSGSTRLTPCSAISRSTMTTRTSSPCPRTACWTSAPIFLRSPPSSRAELGTASVLTDLSARRAYDCDGLTNYRVTPALVVLAADADAVRSGRRRLPPPRVPWVARGSGTGLSGGATPLGDGVVIVTSQLRHILEIDARQPARGRRAGRHQPRRHPRRGARSACTTRPTRPASRSARSAATSPRTPAARTA